MTLSLFATDTVDRYDVTGVKVAKTDEYKAAEITDIKVRVTPYVENGQDVLVVDVEMGGRLLAANGKPLVNGTYAHIYGELDAQDRYEVAREAVLATLARHGFDPALTSSSTSLATQTWDEYQQGKKTALFKSLGMEQYL